MGRKIGTREPKNKTPAPLTERYKLEFVSELHDPWLQPDTKLYHVNGCKVFISPPFQEQGWHMSISHPRRYPTWREIAFAWYAGVPDAETRTGVLVLPPVEDYVNVHEFCMQVHEVLDREAAGLHQ